MTELLLMYLIAAFGCLAFSAGSQSVRGVRGYYQSDEDIFYTCLLCVFWPVLLIACFQYSENWYIKKARQIIAEKIDNLKYKD